MRGLVFVGLIALLGACSVEVDAGHETAGAYEVQVSDDEQRVIYLVSGPDGRTAAQIENGVGALMDANEARLALGEARAAAADVAPPPNTERIHLKLPGLEFSLDANEETGDGGYGRAEIEMNIGGREIRLDAGEDASGRAIVRLTGLSAEDARDFINEAEDLTPEVKAQMLAELGLSAAVQ